MPQLKSNNKKFILVVIAASFVLLLAAWKLPPSPSTVAGFFTDYDTVPQTQKEKIADLEDAFDKLEHVKIELKEQDINKKVNEALRNIDMHGMQEKVAAAMERANLALNNADVKKLKFDVSDAIAKIDMQKIDEQVKQATAYLQPQIQKSLLDAQRQIEQAKQQIEQAKKQLQKM